MTTGEDLTWWINLDSHLDWTFAKTMPECPHTYIVRGKHLDDESFERAVRVIRTFGEPAKFFQRTNIELIHGNTKWWTMGATVGATTVINRAQPYQVYGAQDAPRTGSGRFTVYDEIATKYDARYLSEDDLDENHWIRSTLVAHFGARTPRVLDVGCGTGLLLDLGVASVRSYLGIDPSQAMLNELVRKHPRISRDALRVGTAGEILPTLTDQKFDLVAAIFSGSYLTVEDWVRMVGLSSDLTVIFTARNGHLPDYWVGQEREHMAQRWLEAEQAMVEFASYMKASRKVLGHYDVTMVTS